MVIETGAGADNWLLLPLILSRAAPTDRPARRSGTYAAKPVGFLLWPRASMASSHTLREPAAARLAVLAKGSLVTTC